MGLIENFKEFLITKSVYKNNKIIYPLDSLQTIINLNIKLTQLKHEKIKVNFIGMSDDEEVSEEE